jgi:hypothetical protein
MLKGPRVTINPSQIIDPVSKTVMFDEKVEIETCLSEHFWQVWLISVQRFQRRRFKCEKLTDGRQTLTHDKSSHGQWPGERSNTTTIVIISVVFSRK